MEKGTRNLQAFRTNQKSISLELCGLYTVFTTKHDIN